MNMLEKQYHKMYHKILTDDTRWDLMTAKELEKRIAKFKADEKSQDKMLSMLSCLRLAEILYLYQKNGESTTMPTVPLLEGQVMLIFTGEEKIVSDNLKQFEVGFSRLPELLECFEDTELAFICINPETDDITLPLNYTKEIIEAYDNIQIHVDEQMGEGIKAEELEPIVFERFLGRRIDCETTEGKHIIGDAYSSRMDKKRGLVLVVDLGEDDEVELCQGQVKHIRDITDYGEDSE
ncbi:hypothetical protein [Bacteroides acidifaciens]|uniref:hypothetical protein n=1 Tax=Bacteroides acidifaciens TaxID=85831 RepID=UPI0025B74B61|nr:hypothetical protein [Bacteroides acidifaciens]